MLQELAEEYAIEKNRNATDIIKEIIDSERTKKSYRNIRQALGKQRNSSLLRLIIPQNNPENELKTTKVVSTKKEIHDNIISYNIEHYSKAEASPVGIGTPLFKKNRSLWNFTILRQDPSRKIDFPRPRRNTHAQNS